MQVSNGLDVVMVMPILGGSIPEALVYIDKVDRLFGSCILDLYCDSILEESLLHVSGHGFTIPYCFPEPCVTTLGQDIVGNDTLKLTPTTLRT